MAKQKLFATFIGINTYSQSPLSGCVKDVLDMDLFLRAQAAQQEAMDYVPCYFLSPNKIDELRIAEHEAAIKIAELEYKPATFDLVTTEAFAHFKKAGKGDVCFLYYSGHGSQVEAPEVFWHTKPDRQNETIVCVDSRDPRKPDSRDIIDKELAYLLWDALKGKKVHCLVIMDCCHSGNNTRAAADTTIKATRYRHIPSSKNKVPLENYLGYKEGFYKEKEGKASFEIAQYVQLAACRDAEKAQESNDGGLFSSKLMEVLRSGGTAKSYRELIQGLAITVRNRATEQNPVAFAREDNDLDLQFLGNGIKPYQPSYEVQYDFKQEKWIMHGGAIHNIVPSSDEAKTTVRITGNAAEIKVTEVAAVTAVLDDDDMGLFDKENGKYQAIIASMANTPISIGLSSQLLHEPQLYAALKEGYNSSKHFFFSIDFDNKEKEPVYQVQLTEDKAYILTKNESDVPLFKRETLASNFLKNVDSVCKWVSVSGLENTNSRILQENFTFTLEKIEGQNFTPANIDSLNGEIKKVIPGEEQVFNYVDEMQPAFRLSIQLKNAEIEPLYFGALYMNSLFGIKTDFIKPDSNTLLNKEDVLNLSFINGGTIFNTTPLRIEKIYKNYNINEVTELLKIFVSNEPIDLNRYKQPALELDKQFRRGGTRGTGFDGDDAEEKTDWTVFTFPFRIVGPDKEKKLEPGKSTSFSSFNIEVPADFSAKAFAATGNDLQRKMNTITRSVNAEDDTLTQFISPPQSIWGDVITDTGIFSSGLSAASDNGIKVLEIYPADTGTELKITEGQEIKIDPKQPQTRGLNDDGLEETIVPYGYNEELQLYVPLGFTDDKGIIHIQELPAATPGIIRGDGKLTRSVGSSIKLFFKKIFTRGKVNTLTLYELTQGQPWKKVTEDPTEMRLVFEKNKGTSIVLLIHGIFGSMKDITGSLMGVGNFSSAAKFVLAYDYENIANPLPRTAKALKDDLSKAGFGEGNGCTLSIVAHSMGGLVARRLVETEGASAYVKRLIFAGTPNAGSELAGLKSSVAGLITHALNVTGPIKYALTGLSFLLKKLNLDPGETLTEMSPGSTFLTELSISKLPQGVQYSILGGDTDLLKKGYDGDDYFLKKVAAILKGNVVYPGLSAAVFSNKQNDMAVTLDSMKTITGFDAARMYIVANDHLSYFSEKPCQEKLIELLTH